jgi:RNA polymerase sigma factor (sigma-70 family)
VETKIDISEHIGMAHAVASQFVLPNSMVNVEDTEEYSEACLGLVEAVREYREGDGPFSTYAWKVMRNRIIDFHRRNKRLKRVAKFTSCDLGSVEAVKSQTVLPIDLLPCLLGDKPDEILVEFYLKSTNVQELARRWNVSRVTVYGRMRRALDDIRSRHAALISEYEVENE